MRRGDDLGPAVAAIAAGEPRSQAMNHSPNPPPRDVTPSWPMRVTRSNPTVAKMMLTAHIAQNGEMMPLSDERLAADEPNVIDREHDEADAEHEAHPTARKAQRQRRTNKHEDDARHGQ